MDTVRYVPHPVQDVYMPYGIQKEIRVDPRDPVYAQSTCLSEVLVFEEFLSCFET